MWSHQPRLEDQDASSKPSRVAGAAQVGAPDKVGQGQGPEPSDGLCPCGCIIVVSRLPHPHPQDHSILASLTSTIFSVEAWGVRGKVRGSPFLW